MKNIILATLIFVGSNLSVNGQDLPPNSVKLKVKSSGEKFRYNLLPELMKYSDYKTYELKLSDVNGKEYITKADLPNDVQVKLSMTYIDNLNQVKSGGNFLVDIKRTSSSLDAVSDYKYSTGGDTPIDLYGYEINHNDKFHVTLTDVKGGDGIIFDTTITVKSITHFPKDYDASLKIKNQNSVAHYYNEYIYKNIPNEFKKEKAKEYEAMKIKSSQDATDKYYDYTFNNINESSNAVFVTLTKDINGEIRDLFNGLVSRTWDPIVLWVYDVKTKESAYTDVNIAVESVKEAISVMNENYKNKIYNNFHAENVYPKMDDAYKIFNKYREEKYILPLKEDVQNEFKYSMDLNTFFTAFATSRYDEANQILSQIQKEAKSHPSTGLGFKHSDAEKALTAMEPFIPILKREQQLFDIHKEFYNYYK